MGLTKVTVTITNLSKSKQGYENIFLVDTGDIDCMAPASELIKAGIEVEGKEVYELANGETVEYKYGFARVAFMGQKLFARLFLVQKAYPILGVVALENTGIGVDPVSRKLIKMAAKPLK